MHIEPSRLVHRILKDISISEWLPYFCLVTCAEHVYHIAFTWDAVLQVLATKWRIIVVRPSHRFLQILESNIKTTRMRHIGAKRITHWL
jgi:hypothetical protein